MRTKEIKNQQGETLTTQDGKKLLEHRFEPGDQFIPCYNSVLERDRDIVDKNGNQKTITNYSIKAVVRDKDGKVYKIDDDEELFITLTPAQANSLKKKVDEGVELNQNLFVVYTYKTERYGEQIGVGLKGNSKPHKSFADFDDTGSDDGKGEESPDSSSPKKNSLKPFMVKLDDKLVGKIIGEVYYTDRKPNHYYVKGQGFPISDEILITLVEHDVKVILITYYGKNEVTKYKAKLEQYLNAPLMQEEGWDLQRCVPKKELVVM